MAQNQVDSDRRDFFISHAGSDQQWAEWIARELTAAGYTVELDVWEWAAGADFIAAMEGALARADRVIAVYSAEYFSRPYTMAEHRGAFAGEMRGQPGRVVPVRVEPCEVPDLYAGLIRIDLVGLEESEAANRLIAGVRPRPGPGSAASPFPGRSPASTTSVEGVFYPRRLPEIWNVPARNAFFIGRTELLRSIRDRMAATALDPVPVAVVPLHGMGGIGKTQLAVEYAYRFGTHLGIVWWVNADNALSIVASLSNLAQELSIPIDQPAETLLRQLWGLLSRRTDWLLIYDNVDDLEELVQFKPPDSGQLLITSRNPRIEHLAVSFEIAEFTRPESVDLLQRRARNLSDQEANQLAAAVGDLPLAVEQVAGFIHETGLDVGQYLALLAAEPASAGLSEPTLYRHPGVIAVVETSQARLAARSPQVAATLDALAFLGPDPIPLAASPDGRKPSAFGVRIGDAVATAKAVRDLTALALVRRVGATVQLHRLVQIVLRARLDVEQRQVARRSAQELLGEPDPGNPDEPASWPAFAALTPHILAVIETEDTFGGEEPEAFRQLQIQLARYFFASGKYGLGREVAEATYLRWQRSVGGDHPQTLAIGNRLVGILYGLGEYADARAVGLEVLERQKTTLGPDHPDTLATENNLAAVLVELGDLEASRDLCVSILELRLSTTGPDHPLTLTAANNLGAALNALGEDAEARELCQDNLIRRSRLLGANHPDTLATATTLAYVLAGLAEYAQARAIFENTLARRREILGPDHPDTLYTAQGYADVLFALDEAQALDLQLDTLRRLQQTLGSDHPDTRRAAAALDRASQSRDRLAGGS